MLSICYRYAINVLPRCYCSAMTLPGHAVNALSLQYWSAMNCLWIRYEYATNMLLTKSQHAIDIFWSLLMCCHCAINILSMHYHNIVSSCYPYATNLLFVCYWYAIDMLWSACDSISIYYQDAIAPGLRCSNLNTSAYLFVHLSPFSRMLLCDGILKHPHPNGV